MKNVLVIGSTGQIGSELTMKLREIYTGDIVAGYIPGAEPKGALAESGPSMVVDITNAAQIAEAVAFLCSDKAGFITGQVLGVNGGFVI